MKAPEEATVLVVEDNLLSYRNIVELLAYAGVKRHQWKASGWEVVRFAESMPEIDLVLMDINLPHGNGFQALASIRALPRFQKTPVVAVTGHGGPVILEAAQAAGFNGFLMKPLDAEKFPRQIRALLRGIELWEAG